MRTISTALLLFAVWFLWSGHTEPLLLGFGAASCLLVTWLAHRMRILDDESLPLSLAPRLLLYLPWVFLQIVKANLALARIVLSPNMPIAPQLMTLRSSQRTGLGRAILANTITITPGTVTLDILNDTLYVHALTDAAADEDEAGALDRRVSRLEGAVPAQHSAPETKVQSSSNE